eukprot:gene17894-25022_t
MLSDKIGRKPIIMAGCLIAALSYFPLFNALTAAANPDLAKAQKEVPVTVVVDPAQCSFQGSPIAREVDFRTSCDIAKRTLAQAAVNYTVVEAPAGTVASIKLGGVEVPALNATLTPDGNSFDPDSKAKIAAVKKQVAESVKAAGYPAKADPAKVNKPLVVGSSVRPGRSRPSVVTMVA